MTNAYIDRWLAAEAPAAGGGGGLGAIERVDNLAILWPRDDMVVDGVHYQKHLESCRVCSHSLPWHAL